MLNNDPIVLYFVVRQSLNMNVEETCKQVAHSIQNLMLKYIKMQILLSKKELASCISEEDLLHIKNMNDWMNSGSNKYVLIADENNWNIIKTEQGKNCMVVKTANENAEPIETVISFWPQHQSTTSSELKKLHHLK